MGVRKKCFLLDWPDKYKNVFIIHQNPYQFNISKGNRQTQLFLDDARMKNFTSRIKDEKFLRFFISRLRLNKTNRYEVEFPYISLCGKEKNYVRCDDLPIVFTKFVSTKPHDLLIYNHCGKKK